MKLKRLGRCRNPAIVLFSPIDYIINIGQYPHKMVRCGPTESASVSLACSGNRETNLKLVQNDHNSKKSASVYCHLQNVGVTDDKLTKLHPDLFE
jgi:hypothetical protein